MNLGINAVVQRVQDGTTFGGSDMCSSCRYAIRRKGAQTGFSETRCAAFNSTPVVPVKLASCSSYLEKGRMTLGEMMDAAWIIEARGKHIGFLSPEELERRRRNFGESSQPPTTVGF